MKTWEKMVPTLKSGQHRKLLAAIAGLRCKYTIYPSQKRVMYALQKTPFDKVRVVILGQDPYHGEGQAMGLAFSVPNNIPPPPSLRNIFKEVEADTGRVQDENDLTRWADQGVLLLNTVLTVRAHEANSHAGWGWETITDDIVCTLSSKRKGLVFMLWGKQAQDKEDLIDPTRHLIIKTPHPSPLSAWRGWFGNGCFSRANAYLKEQGSPPILW